MEIVESNKLIAEFMDLTLHKGYIYKYYPLSERKERGFWGNQLQYHESKLKYDKSWDWLMPVVEEISTNHYSGITIMRRVTHITPDEELEFTGTGDSMIEATYKSVIQFINWYNLNK